MLKSTEDYLDLLRQGDFLTALEWVVFVEARYGGKEQQLSADSLLPVAIYELINHGFSKNDCSLIAIIYALINEQPAVLPGALDYAASILVSAAMQCLVYDDLQIITDYKSQIPISDVKTIENLILKDTPVLTTSINRNQLAKKSKELETLAQSESKKIQAAREKLQNLECCQVYYEELMNRSGNSAIAIRAGVIQALQRQLQKAGWEDNSADLISGYVDKIRQMAPEPWEENLYLSRLMPPKGMVAEWFDTTRNTVQLLVGSFFTRLITNPEPDLSKKTDDAPGSQP